jgi:hypothetical protein
MILPFISEYFWKFVIFRLRGPICVALSGLISVDASPRAYALGFVAPRFQRSEQTS